MGGLLVGDGVRGTPTSDNGGLSMGSDNDVFIFNAIDLCKCVDIESRCDDDDDDDRNRLLSILLIPESGDVLQLVEPGPASSIDRRVLSSSVDANATSRSNPELTRSCH